MSRTVSPILLLGLLVITACGELPSIPSAYATGQTPSTTTTSSAPSDEAPGQTEGASPQLLQRAATAKELALDAVRLEGSPEVQEGMKVANPCDRQATSAESGDPAEIGAAAACAIRLEEKIKEPGRVRDAATQELIVKRMEVVAQAAMAGAKKRVAQAQEKKPDAADEAADAAAEKIGPECEKSLASCETKCRAAKPGSGAYCYVTAVILLDRHKNPPDLKGIQLSTEYMQAACDAKYNPASCDDAAKIRGMLPKLAALAEKSKSDAFDEVTGQGDDIAVKMFMATTASKLGGRAARQVPRMRLVIQEQISQQFCPAKKKAVGLMGVVEFNKRSATHCKDEPPTAGGLAGQVTLPNECRTVFASACP